MNRVLNILVHVFYETTPPGEQVLHCQMRGLETTSHRKNGIQRQPDLFLNTTHVSSKTAHGELSGQELKSSLSQVVRFHWNDTAGRMNVLELTFSFVVF